MRESERERESDDDLAERGEEARGSARERESDGLRAPVAPHLLASPALRCSRKISP